MSKILSLLSDAKNKAKEEINRKNQENDNKIKELEEKQKKSAISFVENELPQLVQESIKNYRDYVDIELFSSEYRLLVDHYNNERGSYQGCKYIKILPGKSKFLFEILSAEHLFPQLFYEWFPNHEDPMNHFQDFRCYIRIYLCYIKG